LLDWSEIILRLGAATLAGGLIGLNRDAHGKSIGMRTLGLVSLATAMIVALSDPTGEIGRFSDASSRVVQGILTGIGFLGAGVILHSEHHFKIHGLTSAACTWLTACIGILCGAGQWRIVIVGLVLTFVILFTGGRIEHALHRLLRKADGAMPEAVPHQSSDAGPHQPGR
jgi:putative Mg2+ transporter-C (MgtC) family protein